MTKAKALVVGIGGLAVVLGVVWMSIVFPEFERVPDDSPASRERTGLGMPARHPSGPKALRPARA